MTLQHSMEMKKRGKRPRMMCTTCLKPGAVQYINKKTKQVTYEHRDEPPVREFMYRGHKMYRYRRCNGGIMGGSLSEFIEHGIQQQQQPPLQKPKSKKLDGKETEKEVGKLWKMIESNNEQTLYMRNRLEKLLGTGKDYKRMEFRKQLN